jgi:predicted nucleic acid-binding protein
VSGFLLDTNVISEVVKPEPHPGVAQWIRATDESLLYLSVLTIGELRKGTTRLPSGRRRAFLEAWLDRDLAVRFFGRILPIDLAVAERWGRISGTEVARKAPLPIVDGLLAATALQHNLILVTRDTSHAAVSGVEVFDPWKT